MSLPFWTWLAEMNAEHQEFYLGSITNQPKTKHARND